MARSIAWIARHKALVTINAVLAFGAIVAWELYARVGHRLIQAIYDGKAGPLNHMIAGQHLFPVQRYVDLGDRFFSPLLMSAVTACLLIECLVCYLRGLKDALTGPPRHSPRPSGDLFLISVLILFLELAVIRWFPAYVVFLTFFSNFVLMAAFVGMSVGCLAARKRINLIHLVPPTLLLSVTTVGIAHLVVKFFRMLVVHVGSPTDPEHVFFGTVFQAREATGGVSVPMEVIIAVVFVLIAMTFLGLGQELGRQLLSIDSRIKAYTINIGGSLVGIAGFTLMSWFSLAPVWWFLVAFLCLLWLLQSGTKRLVIQIATLSLSLVAIGGMDWVPAQLLGVTSFWSPYYNIRYVPQTGAIIANGIGQQRMSDRTDDLIAYPYSLPYLLSKDSGRKPLEDVLIIGAGSGNDAAHALLHGVTRIDAVEIDPVVATIGRRDHPNQPYVDPRVNLIVADGRQILKNAPRHYDLIVYAMVDSLALHSFSSSVRLESFLFTRQALEDVRAHLKEHGLFVAYNQYRQGWVATRFKHLIESVFGEAPLVISLPSQETIRDTDTSRAMSLFLAGDIAPIRRRFETTGAYALDSHDLAANLTRNGFEIARQAPPSLERIFPARVESLRTPMLPSDNWPFFYLKTPHIPSHNLWGLVSILALSLALLLAVAPACSVQLNPHFVFLGAGFMLIETNSIIRLSLLFGSTWLVNSIVFFAILLMVLLANCYVVWKKPEKMGWYYTALMSSLVLNLVVDLEQFLTIPGLARLVGPCLLVFLPILFAGIIFASSFHRSRNPDLDFGANIAGIVVGGIFEYFALVTGYRLVLVIVLALYALSTIGLRRMASPAHL